MKKLTLSDYQALAEFRYQIRKFLRFSEQAVRAAGMEVGQYQLMLAIKGMPDGVRPRIRELANRMHIQHPPASSRSSGVTPSWAASSLFITTPTDMQSRRGMRQAQPAARRPMMTWPGGWHSANPS